MDEENKTEPEEVAQTTPAGAPQPPVAAEIPVTNEAAPQEVEPQNQPPVTVQNDAQQEQSSPKPKSKLRIMLIIIITLLLVGAAVYFYYNTDKTDTAQTDNQQTVAQEPSQVAPATTQDVDTITKEVDAALSSAEDVEDVNSDDLSDSSLGL